VARGISARERRLILGAAAMIAVYFLARPVIGRVAALGPQAASLMNEKVKIIAAYRQAVGREGALAAEAAALGVEIGSLEGALLPGATPPLAAADLQTLLKQYSERAGLKIQSEKILPHVKRDAYLEIPVQIVANGEMRNLKEFLMAVDASTPFMAVQEMSLRTIKRRQFVPETRTYLEVSDIQASMTLVGLIHAGKN
jgi:hypothetical protein